MQLIGVGGPTASGKTTAAKNLIKHFGADTNRFSSILATIANDIGLPTDKENLQNLSTSLRTRLGEDALARGMCEWVKTSKNDVIVVEGLRRMTDIESLARVAAETGRTWSFFYIDATYEERFARYTKRLVDEGKEAPTEEVFNALENQECENELPQLKERAHAVIDNTDLSQEEVKTKALSVLENR